MSQSTNIHINFFDEYTSGQLEPFLLRCKRCGKALSLSGERSKDRKKIYKGYLCFDCEGELYGCYITG